MQSKPMRLIGPDIPSGDPIGRTLIVSSGVTLKKRLLKDVITEAILISNCLGQHRSMILFLPRLIHPAKSICHVKDLLLIHWWYLLSRDFSRTGEDTTLDGIFANT
jgi:hypothetical protein